MPIGPSFDAAWTDGVLCVTAVAAAWWSREPGRVMAPLGFGLIALAAAVGTLRLGGVEALLGVHLALGRLAAGVGVPLVGAGIVVRSLDAAPRRRLQRGAALVGLLLAVILLPTDGSIQRLIRLVVPAALMLMAIGWSARRRCWEGVAGPILVVVAGLLILGDGQWLGFERVGWFHLAMAVAVALLGRSARPLPVEPQ